MKHVDPPTEELRGTLQCAVCRLVIQEVELAEELLNRCNGDDDELDSTEIIDALPSVLCEHMQATGQLGHTEARASMTRTMCDDAVSSLRAHRRRRGARGRTTSKGAQGSARPSLHTRVCSPTCQGPDDVELVQWPAALQLLLDQDDDKLRSSLMMPDGLAAKALADDHPDADGAVSALLLLAAARSDTLLIKALCALGVCKRGLRAVPSPSALASALMAAAPQDASSRTREQLQAAALRLLQLHWDVNSADAESEAKVKAVVATFGAVSETAGAVTGGSTALGQLTAVHASAFLLDADALAVMLRRQPSAARYLDAHGREPLYYAAHTAERQKSLAYLFTEQPFRTWLADHSTSGVNFARFLSLGNISLELEAARNATMAILRHHHGAPTPDVYDLPDTIEAIAETPRSSGAGSPIAGSQPSDKRCEIKTLDGAVVTQGEVQSYVLRNQPFVLRHATSGWPAESTITNAADFREDFGRGMWEPQLLLPGNATTLAPYLHRAASGEYSRPISFNRPSDPRILQGLSSQVRWPAVFGAQPPTNRAGLDFFVGPNGSGTPLHHHSAVWNALLFGRKLWALLPPQHATFAQEGEHPLDSDWFATWKQLNPNDAPLPGAKKKTKRTARKTKMGATPYVFCVQKAGSLVYVPSQWAHATLNLDEGAGVGGFLQDVGGLGLHMQMLHAPRGVGSLQNALTLHESWYQTVNRAFPITQ